MTRYERVEDVLALVQALHTTGRGLTIDDIRERFGVSRRTAERMRDVVARAFPDPGFELDPSGRRRWRLPASSRTESQAWTQSAHMACAAQIFVRSWSAARPDLGGTRGLQCNFNL